MTKGEAVGIFSKKSKGTPGSSALQIPDELAQSAAQQMNNGHFGSALETYGNAIDKIHTMCAVAAPGSRIREPGPGDQYILDGFVAALTACMANSPSGDVGNTVERSCNYLLQIASEAGSEGARYQDAVARIESAFRR